MKLMKPVICTLVALLLSLPALADSDHDRARRAVEEGRILPLKDILAKAEASHPGQLLEAELEDEKDRLMYELKILMKGGRVIELLYDAGSGDLMKVEEEEGDDVPSTTFSNYIGTVKIEAKFQETRTKGESETAEQAKALDLAFATELDNLNFKLENEKPYEEHTFEFAQFSISSLNKARDQIVKAKAQPSPEGDTPPAGLPNGLPGSLPPGLIPGGARPSAVTPPVRVPPVENP